MRLIFLIVCTILQEFLCFVKLRIHNKRYYKKQMQTLTNKKTAAPKDGLNTRDLHEKIKRIGYLKPFYREICTRIKSLKQLLSDRRRCHPLPVHFLLEIFKGRDCNRTCTAIDRHIIAMTFQRLLNSCDLSHKRDIRLDPVLTVNG